MTTRWTVAIVAAALSSAAIAQSTPSTTPAPTASPAPIDPELDALLTRTDAKAAAIRDLRAHFVQTKTSRLLKRPIESSGTLAVAGSTVRWDTARPRASLLLINDTSIRIWYPEDKSLEEYPVEESMRRLTASPLPRLDLVRAQFTVERARTSEFSAEYADERYIALTLMPRDEHLAEHVKRVRVILDTTEGLAAAMEWSSPGGDSTRLVFSDVRTNTGVDPASLSFTPPPDAHVSHPLGDSKGGP